MHRSTATVVTLLLAFDAHAQAPRTGSSSSGIGGTVGAVAERTAPEAAKPDPVERLCAVRAPTLKSPVTLRELFESISKRSGVHVQGLWHGKVPGTGLDPDATVSLEGPVGSCGDTLDRALDQVSTASEPALWQATKFGVEAGPRSTLWRASALQVRTYDVSDLLLRVPAFRSTGVPQPAGANGTGTGSSGGSSGGTGDAQDAGVGARRAATREDITALVQRCVVPEAWAANGGPCTIVPHDQLLVVRAPDFVHRLIEQPTPPRARAKAPPAKGTTAP